ncbi:unnamed protein product [Owenia fusiformis]|uniref:Uncharacterized protein n=1 Tax=Owenia fusiformis TaxID=6347 RepID=A0A8J1TBC4_OWEFU|nr:unnamed protein product [Owenia fusiformis]
MVRLTMDTLLASNNIKDSSFSKPKRKRIHIPHSQRPTEFVAQRNERERSRVHSVNEAFMVLKKHVPLKVKNPSKRVSKAKILQAALDHIHNLLDILESRKSQESCSTKKSSLQNNKPGVTPNNENLVKTHNASTTMTTTKKYSECIPDIKENQNHKITNELLFNNSQCHRQIELSEHEQYSASMYNQYRLGYHRTTEQQQYITQINSTYDQCQKTLSQFNTEQRLCQGYRSHALQSEPWTTGNTTVSQQNEVEYFPSTAYSFANDPETSIPYQMTESWMHGLPPSPDSGFADDKSTSGVSEISFPMMDDDFPENVSHAFTTEFASNN